MSAIAGFLGAVVGFLGGACIGAFLAAKIHTQIYGRPGLHGDFGGTFAALAGLAIGGVAGLLAGLIVGLIAGVRLGHAFDGSHDRPLPHDRDGERDDQDMRQ
ncbi:hypothetical protein [Zavarzinella formosa]|uniref:hypothetical protein n=1 Tax=Zavarzinella formosa TaxID=360055 RepID=UPI00187DA41C|nr:hypothetical protein [Zavarzinella formosa]